jgi:small-conductance mechanosensitive channel
MAASRSLQAVENAPASWGAALWILAVFALLALLAQFVLLPLLKRWAGRSHTRWDDLAVAVLQRFTWLWLLLLGLAVAAGAAPLEPDQVLLLQRGVSVLFLLTLTLSVAAALTGLMAASAEKAGLGAQGASLSRTLVRLLVLTLGGLTILSQLGIAITPVLTALGVGSLAVALALQDTLSNLFAGVYIMASKQIHVGDYIKLDTGNEGYVDDIIWRACRLRDLAGYYVLIPNQKLAQSIVTNYHQPQLEIALVVNLGVAYSSDLQRVEKVTCEVAKEALQHTTGAIANFEPFIRYNDFAEGSIKLSVILKIREFVDRFLLVHEFMKRLHARYKAEGIELPAPRMDVHMVETPRM